MKRLRCVVTEGSDEGMTLVELLVSMVLTTLVLAITFSIMVTVERQTKDNQARAESVSQARSALARIDRQVRSGNVLFDPALESLPLSMRVYTQANGDQRCVQWQIHNGSLRMRSWATTWEFDSNVSAWETVGLQVTNDVNMNESIDVDDVSPFKLQSSATSYGPRVVDVSLRVKDPASEGKDVDVVTSLAGRNTIYGYDPGVCDPVPPAGP